MGVKPTLMYREVQSVPERIAHQIDTALPTYIAVGERLKTMDVKVMITVARGSSDHAATYFKYLVETMFGIPLASVGPSIASIYGKDMLVDGVPIIAISQSGGSKDLQIFMEQATRNGAIGIVLTNDTSSALAHSGCEVLDLSMGVEKAVAATKTYIASLTALAGVFAGWSGDEKFLNALRELPENLNCALHCNWDAALKFIETCLIHAESHSAAEVNHGPMALAGKEQSALVFMSGNCTRHSTDGSVERLRDAGSRVFIASGHKGTDCLRTIKTSHPLLDLISQALSFYVFVEKLSVALGFNPDAPRHLNKVTVTV
ncbi:MAG: SIS domain-containing protein [Rhizobiaceae bacterium]